MSSKRWQQAGDGDVDGDDDDDDDDEEAVLGLWGSIFWLGVITVFISFLSEFMVDALQGASENWGVPDLFLGTIVIPIVGNAADHAAAIIFAVKNKMELSLGVAIGSSTQIALVLPLCIVIGWCVDERLARLPPSRPARCCSPSCSSVPHPERRVNWLMGLMLVIAYCDLGRLLCAHRRAGQLGATIVGTDSERVALGGGGGDGWWWRREAIRCAGDFGGSSGGAGAWATAR